MNEHDKNFEKQFRDLNEKLNKMGETMERTFSALGERISEKVQAATEKFNSDREHRHGYRGKRNTYRYHSKRYYGTPNDTSETEKSDPPTKGEKILQIVPFLDNDSLHELTTQFIDGDLEIEMKEVLPFLDENDVGLLMHKILESGGDEFKGLTLEDLLPFADEKDIGELFKEKAKHGVIDEKLINFVDESCFHEIVEEYCNNEDSVLDIDKIYPYLEEEDFKLLFKTYLKRQK